MFEVYIHVPFCLRRCGYCDFNTYTATDLGAGASRGNYANMVIREMKLTKQWQLDHGIEEPPVSTVFFGGGTPTILAARDLVAMLDAVRKIWSIAPDAEITTEANPHTPANVAVGVNAANKAGLRSSVDLIYGAPGESLDDWRTSVTTAIDLGVNHISAYALTVEPTTKMGRQIAAGTLPKPNDDDEAAKYEIADDLFAAAGLEWYEVSNWARPGYESQHNLGYWRNVDWAGLGPGAHSHYNAVTEADHPQSASLTAPAGGSKSEAIASASADGQANAELGMINAHGNNSQEIHAPAGGGCPADAGLGVVSVSHGLRSWDIAHPRLWGTAINENRVPWADSETITPEENLEELIMLGLRLHEGLDLDRINRAINDAGMSSTPQTLRNVSLDQLAPMVSEGLITVSDNHRVVPTRRGRLLNDSVIEQFFDFVGV